MCSPPHWPTPPLRLRQLCDFRFEPLLPDAVGSAALAGDVTGLPGTGFQVKAVLDDILEKIPETFNMAEIMAKAAEKTPYVVVAFQECERMNILTNEMRRSLKELNLGLKVKQQRPPRHGHRACVVAVTAEGQPHSTAQVSSLAPGDRYVTH